MVDNRSSQMSSGKQNRDSGEETWRPCVVIGKHVSFTTTKSLAQPVHIRMRDPQIIAYGIHSLPNRLKPFERISSLQRPLITCFYPWCEQFSNIIQDNVRDML